MSPPPPARLPRYIPLAGTQVFGLLCGLVGVRLSSALVPPEIWGVYGVLLILQRLGAGVTHEGFVQHIQRQWTPGTAAGPFLRVWVRATLGPTLWLVAGLTLVLAAVARLTGLDAVPGWWLWLIGINLATILGQGLHAALQAEGRYWADFSLNAVASLSRTFLPLGLVWWGGATLARLGTGFLLHTVLWAAAGLLLLGAAWRRPSADPAIPAAPARALVRDLALAGLSGWIAAAALRWTAAAGLAPAETGYFIFALGLAGIVPTMLSVVALNASFPGLYAAARAGVSTAALCRRVRRILWPALTLAQGATLGLALIGPWLVGPLIAPAYAPATGWLLAAGGAMLANFSTAFHSHLLIAAGREARCLPLGVSTAVLRIVVIGGLAAGFTVEAWRACLVVLPWAVAALEAILVRRWLRSAEAGPKTPA